MPVRLLLTGISLLFLLAVMVPELVFYVSSTNPKPLTIEEIMVTPKNKLPDYILVKNAQLLQTERWPTRREIDSLRLIPDKVSGSTSMKVKKYNYVVEEKSEATNFAAISYPVFPKNKIKKSSSAAALMACVIIRDEMVNTTDLMGDSYFKDSSFVVHGKFAGDSIDRETVSLLKKNGYKISKNAIVLQKGLGPVPIHHSVIYTILAIALAAICLLSFLPATTLQKYLKIKPPAES